MTRGTCKGIEAKQQHLSWHLGRAVCQELLAEMVGLTRQWVILLGKHSLRP